MYGYFGDGYNALGGKSASPCSRYKRPDPPALDTLFDVLIHYDDTKDKYRVRQDVDKRFAPFLKHPEHYAISTVNTLTAWRPLIGSVIQGHPLHIDDDANSLRSRRIVFSRSLLMSPFDTGPISPFILSFKALKIDRPITTGLMRLAQRQELSF